MYPAYPQNKQNCATATWTPHARDDLPAYTVRRIAGQAADAHSVPLSRQTTTREGGESFAAHENALVQSAVQGADPLPRVVSTVNAAAYAFAARVGGERAEAASEATLSESLRTEAVQMKDQDATPSSVSLAVVATAATAEIVQAKSSAAALAVKHPRKKPMLGCFLFLNCVRL